MPPFHKTLPATSDKDEKLKEYIKQLEELYNLSETISRTSDLDKVYEEILKSIKKILKVDKVSILLFDPTGVLKFKAWTGLSDKYREAAADHSHWEKSKKKIQPILVPDITKDKSLAHIKAALLKEDIRSLAFFPLILKNIVIGKFMIYYQKPHTFSGEEVNLAQIIGKHISFVINKRRMSEDFLNGIADGITIQDPSGRLIFANRSAALASGYSSVEEMLKEPAKWLTYFELRDDRGKKFKLENLPGRKAILEGTTAEEMINYKNLTTKESRWALVKSSPIFDELGETQYAVNIVHDVTERMELEKRKDEFISTASHELKTPIATLKGFTQILEKHNLDDTTKYYLSKMSHQITRISKLVEDLLDVSRIQSGKLPLEKEEFDVVSLIKETANNIQLITGSHKVVVESESQQVVIYADKYRIDEVINNLVSNAIKFSPQEDKVIIKTKLNRKQIIISIKDFGIGISKRDIKRIFEPFFQASNKIRQSFSGLGLGLYISSQIVAQHQGKIWVESEKGEGSTFYFSIPKK